MSDAVSSLRAEFSEPVLAALQAHDASGHLMAKDAGLVRAAAHVALCSDFAASLLIRRPEWLAELVASGELYEPPALTTLQTRLSLAAHAGEEAAMAALRLHRQREMLRIAWRDLNDLATIEQTLRELSELADAAIGAAVDWCTARLEARHGQPRDADGLHQRLIVLGMGKLGGGELNFSSDIDLVFLYPAAGETDGERTLVNEQFFVRLGQQVVRLLDQATAEGFVYRVDMRLRPFGAAGPLAVSFDAFEGYLQQHGRDWERYAYVKARAVTGAEQAQAVFDEVLRPFVYRRYLDYGVFKALRDMKAMIEQEVARRELDNNVKLGPGGIREIEFITQCFQLVRGGNDPSLRPPSLLQVLPRLASRRCLGQGPVDELLEAYGFLRRLENRLQMLGDRQTHELPLDEPTRLRIACSMDLADWRALLAELEARRRRVSRQFRDVVFATADAPAQAAPLEPWVALWSAPEATAAAQPLLAAGVPADQAEEIRERLASLRAGSLYRRMDEPSRQRLDTVMPALLAALSDVAAPSTCFQRLLAIIEAIGRRSAYLALLGENPVALRRLLDIVSRSGFLAAQLATWPMLLDELLDERLLSTAPTREDFREDLELRLAAHSAGDLEGRLNALREFQRVCTFRVAIAEINGELPLMKVSDRLTDIAELALELALNMAWEELVPRYGEPCCRGADGQRRGTGFAIIGYGKLGGLELGYGSDLDIVFVHDDSGEESHTHGERQIANPVFFARLARRIIHFLSIQTTSGMLYEIDTRLRPSGQSGLLVTSLEALERYQREEAWTWEHQALLRARAVAGGEAVRREDLREQVAGMRERMRSELAAGRPDAFDIKQDAGGLADIEFLVQYLVLAHAGERPGLLRWSDNIRQLEDLAGEGILTPEQAGQAAEIYRRYRRRLHQLALAGAPGIVLAEEFVEERAWVRRHWQQAFGH
jgi:glutamate-ammonia-ligase adenylyltransferase